MRRTTSAGRGQVSLEAVIIIGFVLLLMIPLLYVLFSRVLLVQDEFRTIEVTRSIDSISSTVSTVGVIGPNGSAVVEITLPDNVKGITFGTTNSKEIVATVATSLGDIDIVRMVPYNVTGTISISSGQQRVRVTYYDSGLPIEIKRYKA